jgi:glycosyltransferase involved in cell wall biosynthesis
VEKHRDLVTEFISEPDRGQADAVNKGMRRARGDILAWLNSDDMYLPAIFERIAALLPDLAKPAVVHGGVIAFWEGRVPARSWYPVKELGDRLKTTAAIYQPAAFWTRPVWEKAGELNPDYHFVLDWDFFARASEHAEFKSVPELFALYRFHAQHKSSGKHDRRTQEILEMVRRHATPDWVAAFEEVAAQLEPLSASLARLRRHHLYFLRKLLHPGLYRRHGARVKTVLSQLDISPPLS